MGMYFRTQAKAKEVKTLHADVAIGASGAPTLTKGFGVTAIARNSAGDYTVTLSERCPRLLHVSVTMVESDLEDLNFQVKADRVDSSTKDLDILCKAVDGDGAPTAADPSSGSRLLIRIDVQRTAVGN